MSKIAIGKRVSFEYGFAVRVSEEQLGEYPVYGSNGVTGYIDSYKIKGPGVIVGRKGSVGKVVYTDNCFTPTDTAYYLKIKNKNDDDLRFWAYFLPILGIEKLNSHSAVPGLSRELVYLIEYDIPSIDSQKKIAKVLSSIDAKIELNNRINAELEAMAKTLYDYWFVQFDFPDANGKPYKTSGGKMVYNAKLKREIPEGWEAQKISNFVSIGSGYPFDSESFKPTGNYKIITIKNVQDGSLEAEKTDCIDSLPEGIKSFCILEIGDVLMSLTGNVGRLCLVDQNHLVLNQRVGKLLVDKKWKIFFYIYFNRPETKSWLENISTGSSQKNLSPIDAVKKYFATPLDNVLDEFNALVFKNFELIINNSIENQQLKAIRDWLLPMLMNGQVSIKL